MTHNNDQKGASMSMHGRSALAVLAVSLVAAGCGSERATDGEPVAMQIAERTATTTAPTAPTTERRSTAPRPTRPGPTRAGTFKAQRRVKPTAPPAARAVTGRPAAVVNPSASRRKGTTAAFRQAHLRALRAHCRLRPADDPRCIGAEVDERVAFAAFDAEPTR